MPKIEGEKWACASCIKGHRVSGCTHTDRELHHINPKGRPVKQCEHCRGARKSKSHHAKCDCGDKKDKDKQKAKAETKSQIVDDITVEAVSNYVLAAIDERGCRCHDGAKCVCGIKKEPLDAKLDITAKPVPHLTKNKPRLTSTHSESTLLTFQNGHHKPCHRLNNAAHNSGMPYKIPRPHTLHGPLSSSHPSYEGSESVYSSSHSNAQRSLDSLALADNSFYDLFGSASQRSADSLPLTPITGDLDLNGKFDAQSLVFPASQDTPLMGSDSGSPRESLPLDGFAAQQWTGWLNTTTSSSLPAHSQFGLDHLSTSPATEFLGNGTDLGQDLDWAIPSAGLDPSWSAGDLPLDPGKLENALTQPLSHSGESNHQSMPGLTNSSSGTQSEIGEPAVLGDFDLRNPTCAGNDKFTWDETIAFRDTPSYYLNSSSYQAGFPSAPTSVPSTSNTQSLVPEATAQVVQNTTMPTEPSIPFSSAPTENLPSKMTLPANYVPTTQPDMLANFRPSDYPLLQTVSRPTHMASGIDESIWLPLDLADSSFDVPSFGSVPSGLP